MADGRSRQTFEVLIIGSGRDHFIGLVCRKFREMGLKYNVCVDIYEAFGRLLGFNRNKRTLVIGRLTNLVAEKGRFLTKAAFYGCLFCCLADKQLQSGHLKLFTDYNIKPIIINEIDRLDEIILRMSDTQFRMPDSRNKLFDKDTLLTEQEIEALFSD